MPQQSVRYNVRWGSRSRSDANTSALEKCERYKRKLHATLRKNKALAQKNRVLVQALEAAKAKIVEHEATDSRQLKIDNLILPRLKAWLDESKGCTRTLLGHLMRATKLVQDILNPEVNITLAAETSLQDEVVTPEPRPSLHPPGSRYCEQDLSLSKVLEEDEEEDRTEVVVEPLRDSTEPLEAEPDISLPSKVTVRKKSRHSGRRCSLPDEFRACLDQPSGVPAFAVLDEGASSLLTEITGQAKNIVRAETVVMPPPDKLQGHSADEYSAAFSHRPKIPRTPCKADKEEGAQLASEDACPSPKQRRLQPCRVSEIPLLPWPRKPVNSARTLRSSSANVAGSAAKEFGTEVTNASPLSSPTSVLDEAFVESPSTPELLKKAVPSPERAGESGGDENSPPEAKVRRSRSIVKSRPSDNTKRKASRVTFVVRKGRSQVPEDDGSVGPVDDDPAPPHPGIDGQREPGCGDCPRVVEETTLPRPAAPDVAGPSAWVGRRRASLPAQQRGTVDKSRVKKSQGKKAAQTEELAPKPAAPVCEPTVEQRGGSQSRGKETADIEEPAIQPAAPEPVKKQVVSTKPRGKKLPSKRTAEDAMEEPAAQPSALAAKPDTATLGPAEKHPKAGKSRVKKLHGKRTAHTEESAPKPAAPVCEDTVEQLGGSESRGKETADIEKPALQPAAPAAELVDKQVAKTKPRGKRLPSKRTAEDAVEEPVAQPSALSAKPDTATLGPAEQQPKAGKSRVKKAQRKRTADTEEKPAPEAAAPESPPPCAEHSGHRPLTEPPLDVEATSSTGSDTGPQDRPSGRPARTSVKCTSYKLPSLSKKMRRS